MANDLQNFVGGQWTDLSFDDRADILDPSTGEVFATAPVSGANEVDAAVSSAAEAFPGGCGLFPPVSHMIAIIKNASATRSQVCTCLGIRPGGLGAFS